MTSDKHIVLVTGGNTGLGLEIIRALHATTDSKKPYHIIVGARNPTSASNAIKDFRQNQNSIDTAQIDLESDESIEALAKHIKTKYGRLDTLVNNAGVQLDFAMQEGKITAREAWTKTWSVNVAGTSLLTEALIPLLLQSSEPRILFITSGTSSFANTEKFDTPAFARINASPEKGWPKPSQVNPVTIYRSSKTGLNMLIREWAKTLKNDGVKVFAVSPGFLKTSLGGLGEEKLAQLGAVEPTVGGAFVRDVVQGLRDADAGKAIIKDGVQPW